MAELRIQDLDGIGLIYSSDTSFQSIERHYQAIIGQTDKSVWFVDLNGEEFNLPKSQLREDQCMNLCLSSWLYAKEF